MASTVFKLYQASKPARKELAISMLFEIACESYMDKAALPELKS